MIDISWIAMFLLDHVQNIKNRKMLQLVNYIILVTALYTIADHDQSHCIGSDSKRTYFNLLYVLWSQTHYQHNYYIYTIESVTWETQSGYCSSIRFYLMTVMLVCNKFPKWRFREVGLYTQGVNVGADAFEGASVWGTNLIPEDMYSYPKFSS